MDVSSSAEFWWDSNKSNQENLWESWIELGEKFYEAVRLSSVPVDLRALRALKRSLLASSCRPERPPYICAWTQTWRTGSKAPGRAPDAYACRFQGVRRGPEAPAPTNRTIIVAGAVGKVGNALGRFPRRLYRRLFHSSVEPALCSAHALKDPTKPARCNLPNESQVGLAIVANDLKLSAYEQKGAHSTS